MDGLGRRGAVAGSGWRESRSADGYYTAGWLFTLYGRDKFAGVRTRACVFCVCLCVCVCVYTRERDRESMCVCVRAHARERVSEKERETAQPQFRVPKTTRRRVSRVTSMHTSSIPYASIHSEQSVIGSAADTSYRAKLPSDTLSQAESQNLKKDTKQAGARPAADKMHDLECWGWRLVVSPAPRVVGVAGEATSSFYTSVHLFA